MELAIATLSRVRSLHWRNKYSGGYPVHPEDNPDVPEICGHMNRVADALRPALPFAIERTEYLARGAGREKSVDLLGRALSPRGMTTARLAPLPGGRGFVEQRCPETKTRKP